jgi:hypothetical protein
LQSSKAYFNFIAIIDGSGAQKIPGGVRHLATLQDPRDRQKLEKEIEVAYMCKNLTVGEIEKWSLAELAVFVLEIWKKCRVIAPLRVHCHMCTKYTKSLFAQKLWQVLGQSLRIWMMPGDQKCEGSYPSTRSATAS